VEVATRVLGLGHVLDHVDDVAEREERVAELALAGSAAFQGEPGVESIASVPVRMVLAVEIAVIFERPVGSPGSAEDAGLVVSRIVEVVQYPIRRFVLG
jgi:hypothetical protein